MDSVSLKGLKAVTMKDVMICEDLRFDDMYE
jgi:hypothetical protein